MKIGTDVCLNTCRKEGYLMMEFKKRKLIVRKELQKDVVVRFYQHYPDYVLEDMYGCENPVGERTIMMDVNYSANEIWFLYLEHKEEIDSFVGLSHEFPTCEYSLLSLASDVDSYKSLDN